MAVAKQAMPGVRLREILAERALGYVFQPIVDLSSRALLGYEALMRGPAGTALHTPDALLAVARSAGLLRELELTGCSIAVERFARLGLPGKLFLNASASIVERIARDMGGTLLRAMVDAGFAPTRLVIELTEHERVEDVASLAEAVTTLRAVVSHFQLPGQASREGGRFLAGGRP